MMQEYTPVSSGKVREIYDIGDDNLILYTTDRISAFDVILKSDIPEKGKVLNGLSSFWFDFLENKVKSHIISTDTKDMPEFFSSERFEGRVMLVKKLKMIPVECIVRGYLTGSGLKGYQKDGTVCGIKLKDGLTEASKIDPPIYTPSTKEDIGGHDENISFERSIDVIEGAFSGKGEEYAKKIKDLSVDIYSECAGYALEKGIIIADTKFEFGIDGDGEVVLADEVLTPDSSRFWPKDEYREGITQNSFDKQYVRNYLKAHEGSEDLPLPRDVVEKTRSKYKEAYRLLTGKEI